MVRRPKSEACASRLRYGGRGSKSGRQGCLVSTLRRRRGSSGIRPPQHFPRLWDRERGEGRWHQMRLLQLVWTLLDRRIAEHRTAARQWNSKRQLATVDGDGRPGAEDCLPQKTPSHTRKAVSQGKRW